MKRFGMLTRYSVCFTRGCVLCYAGGRDVGFGVCGRGLVGCFGVDTGSSRCAGASLSAALGIGSGAGGDVVGGERPSRGVSWGRRLPDEALSVLGLSRAPCHATYRYFFKDLDAVAAECALGLWLAGAAPRGMLRWTASVCAAARRRVMTAARAFTWCLPLRPVRGL